MPSFPSFPFNIDEFNLLVSHASEALVCDSECQYQKQAANLKQIYENAQSNLASAPNQLEVAEKNYIVFTQAQSAYNNLQNKKLQEKAEKITNEFKENFNKEVVQTNSLINSYNRLISNFSNVVDLYIQLKSENMELFEALKDKTGDVLTNERKIYYEDQNINNLSLVYFYFLLVVYVICTGCFIIFYFIYPSTSNWKTIIAFIFVFILLPFGSTWILANIIYLFNEIYKLLPKNVYAQKNY
jgi:hypothetical protein